jgi:NADPH-dependent glutamate synthase beta subunit-like oxidoreductase
MSEIPGSEFIVKADLVFLAMGFVSPVGGVLDAFGVDKDARGNAKRIDRWRRLLQDERRQGLRRRRHAPRPVARGVGHPRGTPVRARRR